MNQSFSLLPNEKLKELDQKLDIILSLLQKKSKENSLNIIGGKWISEKDAQKILGKKATSLWKMRRDGELSYTKIRNDVFYDFECILKRFEKNKQEAFK